MMAIYSMYSAQIMRLCISAGIILAVSGAVSAQTFTNVNISFDEGAAAGFPTSNTTVAAPSTVNSANYDVLNALGAEGQDGSNDLLTTFTSSAGGALAGGGLPNLQWQIIGTGSFVSSRGWVGAVSTNNPGTRHFTTTKILFGSHLTVTDLSVVFSSLNTQNTSWEFSTIAFLDPSGNYFTPAPATPLYNAATSFSGSPSQGWYVAADKGTVTGVGTAATALGAAGSSDSLTATYTNMGLTAGTQIGGFEWTTFMEDTRGTSNGNTTATASMTGFTFSGLTAATATPEPGTLALLLAPAALVFLRRRQK
jgi:hypothetical protein